ncbi:hypothetical protein ASG22_20385 [Chryseobacterium sp. Leaf405]|uniref:response regulator transcription factor n=1 Tax=Chryseobacterium sp. Leaf405 TaxID=1736367 RepID=UPI0006F71E7C|nr:LuxR C-terminal-related transcriptional regulator [Chryseobacterium sp. Leaf405]KQT27016.1 hypothetical protein ASG22_20385 [Chryseobacterium sp. Leaf405]
MNKKILIADGNFLTMTGISVLLAREYPYFIIDTASTLEETQHMLSINTYDLLLLDIDMLDIDKTVMIFKMKNIQSPVTILLYPFSSENALLKYMNNGNFVFLSKKSERKEIVKAIDDLVEIGCHYPPKIIPLLKLKPLLKDRLMSLTAREFQVFEYLAKGFKDCYIADMLEIKSVTISKFKRNILKKLMVKNSIQLSEIYNKYN